MNEKRHLLKLAMKSLPYLKKKAQKAFNDYIRFRDHGENCISCKTSLGQHYHAGHFFSVGAHPSVRFDEDNVWGSCVKCNTFLHGNLVPFKENLIKKIGIGRFNALEKRANTILQRKKLDYIYIILKYKNLKN